MCLTPSPLMSLLPALSALWLWLCLCRCEAAIRNASYQSVTLAQLCPQLRPNSYLSENDVQLPEPKTVNLGLGVATLLDERLNSSVFQRPFPPPAIDCLFEVTTGPESAGIFVVLSELSALRRWSNGSCQDYLKINYSNYYSPAICAPVGQAGGSILSFDSSIGEVKIQLHLDNSGGGGGSLKDFQMRLKLVLTSYFDCAKERGGFSCTGTNERCIPVEYVGDGLINCDVPNCRDEGSCVNRPTGLSVDLEYQDSVSVTILIGLVSFVTTGLLFGLFLWFCLKRNFKQRLTATASTPNLDMELSNVYGTPQAGAGRHRGSDAVPGSSAMDQNGVPSPSADPPPSYDILFPDK